MKILILYHTTYGHTLQLARAVEEGVKSWVDGLVQGTLGRPSVSKCGVGVGCCMAVPRGYYRVPGHWQ